MKRSLTARPTRRWSAAAVAAVAAVGLVAPPVAAAPTAGGPGASEVAETRRLADRRALVSGARAFAMSDASGLYPATGWHIRGEMGGFWSPPVKLLDGLWLAVDGEWLGAGVPATRYTRGHGYQRFDYAAGGLRAERVEFVPEGRRATVVGLTLRSATARSVTVGMDTYSELMPSYPWGWTTPSAGQNAPDTGAFADGALLFRDTAQDYAALAGSTLRPTGHALGGDHRGPQSPAVVCPADGAAPARCDDSAFGRGTGGRLDYRVDLRPGKPTTVWFAVAGSDKGVAEARAEYTAALRDPERLLRETRAARADVAGRTVVDLPGDRLLQRSVEWSKQNLADSVQEARDLRIRDVDEGKAYPPAKGVVPVARWLGAGFPDYPWIFATDGEYTAYAAVAAGMFDEAMDHLRVLRDVSDILNDRSGKVAHEVVPTGDVYFGSNEQPGNTDETAKFPSAVALVWRWSGDDRFRDEMYDFAVRNMRYIERELDADGDGWPEGRGNVEREGMGEEKLDSTVYYIRGLYDLADLARAKGDRATADWAARKAADLEARFDAQWWVAEGTGYAESIDTGDGANTAVFQRHWTGVAPMEVELVRPTGRTGPLGEHGPAALAQREKPCYTGEFGLFHTGSGPTADPAGNPGPTCDPVVSAVRSERSTFSLNTAVMAVAEGNHGRLDQQRRYTTGNARIQLDPAVWETPGAMPEIAPSPDFVPNIDRPFYDRSMMLQAWGAYGVLWPVVHQYLGVSPDLGRDRVAVVPQLPPGQNRVAGTGIRVGDGDLAVTATRDGRTWRTTVDHDGPRTDLRVGAVLPANARVASVTVDGRPARAEQVRTARGLEVTVQARGDADVRITTR